MPHHPDATFHGTITHVFGHRFVVQGDHRTILADITPKGVGDIELEIGDVVDLTGEMKPTELKVSVFRKNGRTTTIAHEPKHHHDHPPADPETALRSVRDAGYISLAAPRRKPKHFEILAKRANDVVELHVELGGHIRKSKSADRNDPKWTTV